MKPITSIDELRLAIQIHELERTFKAQQLKEQLMITHESLKPVNLIKSALYEVASSPLLVDNMLGATVGLASGYFSRKLVVGGSHNIIRNFLGTVLQFGVTNVVAQQSDPIKSIGKYLYQHLFRKNKENSEKL
jgi:hypothetical protein